MMWCLWSSIVARQQATVTVRTAAKHTVLRSQKKQPKDGHLQPHLPRGFGIVKLCTYVLLDILSQLVCWSKIAKELGRKTNKQTHTHPYQKARQYHKNAAVILAAVLQKFMTVFESAGKNINDCMQISKMSIAKYKSTINNHLRLSGLDSVQLTNALLKEMQLRHT